MRENHSILRAVAMSTLLILFASSSNGFVRKTMIRSKNNAVKETLFLVRNVPSANKRSFRRFVSSPHHQQDIEESVSPWNDPRLMERAQGRNGFRSRQHVNPLAEKFQRPTELSQEWPNDVFDDLSKPLFLDIGCSRGGFLLDISMQRPDDFNYLGLEIRPIIVHQAKQRIETHNLQGRLDFVGCNANVDLERLLLTADAKDKLKMVAIQFPDPHFKARHAKRRVVTPELVTTLAKFMPEGGTVFLQSDIQSVLDEMRLQFRLQEEFFRDDVENIEEYQENNFFGIPTERETSVLERGLPVYRTTFTRTAKQLSELTA